MALAATFDNVDDQVMTTTVSVPSLVIGARRAIADELRALAEIVSEAPWPPWSEPGFEDAMACLRLTIDQQLEGSEDARPAIAARLGLDFESLERLAADPARVQRWVTILTGSPADGRGSPRVLAELLSIYLYVDELAYIGMLARAIGPVERSTAAS